MAITYNAGTNTITVVGGFFTGVTHATLTTTTQFRDDTAFTGNTPTTWQGRYIWFYNSYTGVADLEKVIRRVDGTVYQRVPITSAYPWEQAYPSTNYIASYTMADVYAADVAGGWGKVQQLGTDMYKISAKLIIGDGTTTTFLTFRYGMIDFGATSSDKYGLLIKTKACFQQGEFYAGLAQGGGAFRLWSNSAADSTINGIWRAINTAVQLENQITQSGATSIVEFNRCKLDGFSANTNISFYVASGETSLTDTGTAQLIADAFRNFSWTFRNNPILNNAVFSHNVLIDFQRVVLSYYLYVYNLVVGGGDVAISVTKWDSASPHYVRFVNPTNLNIASINLINNGMTIPIYAEISQSYNCQIITTAGANISGALVDFTNKDLENTGRYLTDAGGLIGTQSISVSSRRLWIDVDTTFILAPYKIRYFKYGKIPLEFTQEFTKSITDKIILSDDTNITKSYADAIAVSGVTINSGVYSDSGGNLYSYQVDCGGNSLIDAYHNLAARLATNDSNDSVILTARTNTIDILKTSNGSSFYGAKGYTFTNYTGVLDFTVSNDGVKFTPLIYSFFSITNLQLGSEVDIYDVYGNAIGGVESAISTTFVFQYDYVGISQDITVVVFHQEYQPVTFSDTLDGIDKSIPIFQVYDRVYYNPPAPEIPINYLETTRNTSLLFTTTDLMAHATYKGSAFNISHLTSIAIMSQPSNGGTIIDNGNNTFTYTPVTGFTGIEEFTFKPTYNVTYEGTIPVSTARCDVALFRGNSFENLIILGDSISYMVWQSGTPFIRRFNDKHKELYGRELNIFNEAVGGWHTSHLRDAVNGILSKHTALDASKTLVTVCIGTNNIQGWRLANDATKATQRNNIKNDLTTISNTVNSYGFTFEILQVPFLPFDTGNANETVWSMLNNTLLHEELGSLPWNYEANGINDVAEILTPEFVNSNGEPIDQLYNYTYLFRDIGYSDIVHPSEWGRWLFQQCILDTVFLYNALGKKPLRVDKTLNHQAVINLTNSSATAGGVLDLNNRLPNNMDYTAGITNAPIYMNDATLSPWTITISTNGTLVASGNTMSAPEEYLPNDYLEYGVQVPYGQTLSITLNGLTANNVYKFQAIGSYAGTKCVGVLTDPVRNLSSICSAGLFSKDNGATFIANTREYYDLTLIPSGTSITLTLSTFGIQTAAYINAIQLWLLAV
jgi:hypothetical protein